MSLQEEPSVLYHVLSPSELWMGKHIARVCSACPAPVPTPAVVPQDHSSKLRQVAGGASCEVSLQERHSHPFIVCQDGDRV